MTPSPEPTRAGTSAVPAPAPAPGGTGLPACAGMDGCCEDVDGNGRIGSADVAWSSTLLRPDPSIPFLACRADLYSMAAGFDQDEVARYAKFRKVDGAAYEKVNRFLRRHTYITAREWALARLCADFRTTSGAEMTFIGQHLPELVPFMTEPYSPQAVNQARNSFKKKVRKSGATFFYGAMCGFFTTEELDDLLFEASEIARFLLEVEGTSLAVDDELDIEDRIATVMRSVGLAAQTLLETRARGEEE
jgi:hypothetical protein